MLLRTLILITFFCTLCNAQIDRLETLKNTFPKIVFTKHFDIGGSHYAYTEAQSDAQNERNFVPGSALCLLELNENGKYVEKTLISDPNGVIRDPDVSYDGKKIIFAWKKSDREDDYHLYEYTVENGVTRQLTFGLGYADYEPCVQPDGGIIFNSSRCVQIVDCWFTEVSNLYRCDKDGKNIVRLSFDQVHTNYPTQLEDGRIIYTRWDYNDRGHLFPQALFQMNPDGTSQTEFYGNNSYFPTTIMHARGIPNTGGKILAVLSGHHNRQYGKMGIIDPSLGRQEASGIQRIAPIQKTTAERIDAWGQQGERFSHPYPINEREFIVSYNPNNEGHTMGTPFGIYWMDIDGNRELLVSDASISCNQPVPLAARKEPPQRASHVDWSQNQGTYTIQDVYFGPGLAGVERGKAKTLRVVALDFRTVGIGRNGNGGEAGGALVSTPIAIGNGTWDVKIPIGDADIYPDGSASFTAPARTPLYFQILDENGFCIQTMRSWTTLQPGETFSCLGCHEDKNVTMQSQLTEAMKRGPQSLRPLPGNYDLKKRQGFSFAAEIQPILDKHCVSCHDNAEKTPPFGKRPWPDARDQIVAQQQSDQLLGKAIIDNRSEWHFSTKKPAAGWRTPQFFETAKKFPTGKNGFGVHGTPTLVKDCTLWNTPDLWLWQQVTLPDNWTPQPLLLRYFHDEDIDVFVNGAHLFGECAALSQYQTIVLSPKETAAFVPGKNVIAVHVKQIEGGQGFDLGLFFVNEKGRQYAGFQNAIKQNVSAISDKPFSLKPSVVHDQIAKRNWPLSYLNLTGARFPTNRKGDLMFFGYPNRIANWLDVQSSPEMRKPYTSGSSKSELLQMFNSEETHNGIKLSPDELTKLTLWIDLLVPFGGNYSEGNTWNDQEIAKFERYEKKRRDMHAADAETVKILSSP